uniref:Uncharacterized protein n=1 Tax=Anguilla anguilla TaxID=7936 RepID=A0A0E9U5K3_ANGAN
MRCLLYVCSDSESIAKDERNA